MKRLLIVAFLVILATAWAPRAAAAETPFAYPQVPDSITDINARYNYFVTHFWDRVDLKRAFSSKPNVKAAFADYVAPMRFADADVVYASVNAFIDRLRKQPADLLYVAELAEAQLYSDTASVPSDELYVAFLRPILACKKIDRNLAARFDMHLRQLQHSLKGKPLGELQFTDREGRRVRFMPRGGQALIIYFNDPDCSDCSLAKTRLMADFRAAELIESGQLAILALTPGDPDEHWRAGVASYPDTWLTGADPDLDLNLDLRSGIPSFYLVDEQGNVAAKHLSIDTLLNILRRI